MNCQEINQLLDANASDELTRMQSEKIERHFASCAACREDWVNWHEIASLEIPATPVGLRGRVAVALLPHREASARRTFRPFIVGGLVLAGAALAAAAALQLVRPDPGPATMIAEQTRKPVQAEAGALETATSEPVTNSSPQKKSLQTIPTDAVARPPTVSRELTEAAALDPHRILVLMRPETAADALALGLARQCYDAAITELRAIRGLNVVSDATAYTSSSTEAFSLPERDRKIARSLGAGNVLQVTTMHGCFATLFNSQTGAMISGSGGVSSEGEQVDSFAKGIAQSVSDKTLLDGTTELAQARATILNTTLSDRERAAALWKNPDSSGRNALRLFFDKEVVAAAIQIGSKSADAEVRETVWAALRHVDDPSLVPPLLHALANDSNSRARSQAALDLNTFLDYPGVHDALRRAASEDPSREPETACCILSVREAAQRASVADKDFRNWVRSTLLDESLTARSRLLALQDTTPDGRFMMLSISDLGADAAGVAFNIGRREQDPVARMMAWKALKHAAPDNAFVPVLIEDLTSHADERVRAAAAEVLMGYVGNPEVRAAFDRALGDSSMYVRRVVSAALAPSGK